MLKFGWNLYLRIINALCTLAAMDLTCLCRLASGFVALQCDENRSIHDSMTRPNIEFISYIYINGPQHEISNNMVCATSTGSDQSAHTRSLIRVFASRLNIL